MVKTIIYSFKDLLVYILNILTNMALIKEFFELTKKYEDEYGENTIFLMQVGSFLNVMG